MRSFLSVRRAWPVRLIGATLFAVGAALLAHATGGSQGPTIDTAVSPQLGSASASISRRTGDLTIPGGSRTFQGTTIVVSAGPWTHEAIYQMLDENGLRAEMADRLVVRVEAAFPPTRLTTTLERDGVTGRSVRRSTLWLDAWPESDFSRNPESTIAHHLGLLWIAHRLEGRRGFWTGYLRMRGLTADLRLRSNAIWSPNEILADDYRLLFGSAAAIEQQPAHMNRALADPRSVTGLRDFLAGFLPPSS